ncbi:MAG TPA: sigma 54 modulation/S30EA ribosomal C-terminal domain-containing protein, partial [Thermomicrobiaceae bacterium]|nr:sigma 54 modulation/S30EA ribosomal C-terminal domain-containing protein [Thermomicrobiaceae bacterium]
KRVYARRRQQQITHADPPTLTFPDGQVDSPQDIATLADEDEDQAMPIVRRKRFKVLPMDEEEAVEQMELLGHDFFVFFNADDEAVNVLYRRRDGQYGLIQPDLA